MTLYPAPHCRKVGLVALAAGLLLAPSAKTWSGEPCAGKYHVLPLGPWPRHVAFNVPLLTTGAAGQVRAAALRAGLKQSGLQLNPASPIVLEFVFSVASSTTKEDVFTGLDWHPVDAELGSSLKDPSLQNSSLSITAIVNDGAHRRNIWVGTMHCTIKTDDGEELARDIGLSLGQAIVSSVSPYR